MPVEDFLSSHPKSLREILTNREYTVHYYQREYRWRTRQIEQLLDDLLTAFPYVDGDDLESVREYKHYFMGSIIEINDHEKRAIIDGQQRLTSFTLLLIYLRNRQKGLVDDPLVKLDDLICFSNYGKKNFNLSFPDDPERAVVLDSLFKGKIPDGGLTSDSAVTMVNRYKDIERILGERLDERRFFCFMQWVVDKTAFIEIIAEKEQDAYKIFVSMNDRGLSLSSTEMLKGFLLSRINDKGLREEANIIWNKAIAKVMSIGGAKPDDPDNKQDLEFFRAFLRAKFAQTLREGKKDAEDMDYELLGNEFHEWMFQNASAIGFHKSDDYYHFVTEEVPYFASLYSRLLDYGRTLTTGYEHVFYNSVAQLGYQYMLIMASVSASDSSSDVDAKIKTVSYFVEYFAVERRFNWAKDDWNTTKYFLFRLMKQMRGLNPSALGAMLAKELRLTEISQNYSLEGAHRLTLNNANGFFFRYFLARFTSELEMAMGDSNSFVKYMNRDPKKGKVYDREHILVDHFELYGQDFSSEVEFASYRSRLGNFVLLPFDKNRSYNDEATEDKIRHYYSDNILAGSLNKDTYTKNPSFVRVKDEYGFKPYDRFGKTAIEERSDLYETFAKKLWNIESLRQICGGWSDEIDAEIRTAKPKARERKIEKYKEDAMTLEQWLLRFSDRSVELFRGLMARVVSLGEVKYRVKNDYVGFYRADSEIYFCEIHCLKSSIYVNYKVPEFEITDANSFIIGHGWPLDARSNVSNEDDMTTAMKYVKNSFDQTRKSNR